MDAQRNHDHSLLTAAERTALRHRRYKVEASLLAYRSGWLEEDEIRLRKLRKELLDLLSMEDDALVRVLLES